MRVILRKLLNRLREFRLVEDGVAAVEFAGILPMLLLLYIGSVEASALISMDRRVQQVAGSIGDLVARSDTAITTDILKDYFTAAGGVMTPFPVDGLRQIVTQVLVKADGSGASVVWSKQYLNGAYATGTSYPANSAYTLPAEMRTIAKGSYVIVSEVTYSYLPIYGIVYDKPILLYRQNFFMPRFGGSITVN